jgi:hypothetical protein
MNYAESPCSLAAFVVNSDSQTGARPSIRLCAGLTTKAATLQGNSAKTMPSPFRVALGPVVARARVFVQEAALAEELAE